MNEKITITEIDVATGTESIRELSEEELEDRINQQEQFLSFSANLEARNEARQSALAKLAALGLTEEEIAAL
jgi:DNA-directed RNA polymerase specialized sigma24 family protein